MIISIIIPYFHGIEAIKHCISSLLNSYNQTQGIEKPEIIVVLDSMDDKKEASDYLTKLYPDLVVIENKKNLGVAESRNRGILKAKGDFVYFIDQDDQVTPRFFSELYHKKNTSSDLLHFNGFTVNHTTKTKRYIYYRKPIFSFYNLVNKITEIPTPSLLVFKKRILTESFFPNSGKFKGSDDWGAYLNLSFSNPKLKVEYINSPIVNYNIHNNNFSQKNRNSMFQSASYFLQNIKQKCTDLTYLKWINRQLLAYQFKTLREVDKVSVFKIALSNPKVFFNYVRSYFIRGNYIDIILSKTMHGNLYSKK